MTNKRAKKQRRRASGVDPNEQRRQRLEARRQAKAEAVVARRRKERRERIVRTLIFGALIVAVIYFLFLRERFPSEIEGAQGTYAIEELSSSGLQQHQEPPISYPDRPPVSGTHAPSPAPCGTYATPIPDENFVHSLEHGAVGILFDPTLEIETIRQIESIVGEFDSEVLSASYDQLGSPIMVTSWSRRMPLDAFDEQAIREYINAFRAKGPEAGASCESSVSDQFTPEEAQPSPSPEASPGAEPSPEGEQPSPEVEEPSPEGEQPAPSPESS